MQKALAEMARAYAVEVGTRIASSVLLGWITVTLLEPYAGWSQNEDRVLYSIVADNGYTSDFLAVVLKRNDCPTLDTVETFAITTISGVLLCSRTKERSYRGGASGSGVGAGVGGQRCGSTQLSRLGNDRRAVPQDAKGQGSLPGSSSLVHAYLPKSRARKPSCFVG